MSAVNRLSLVSGHLSMTKCVAAQPIQPAVNNHELNPTYFLPRSAEIEPNAKAIVHKSRTEKTYFRTYREWAERVKGLAYFFKHNNFKRIAILAPNTPGHLETMYAGVAAGGIIMGVNYRLTKGEIAYILELGNADLVMVDAELVHLVDPAPGRTILVDQDIADEEASTISCDYYKAVQEGIELDNTVYQSGWEGLHPEHLDENGVLGLFFTSGTTGKPKAVEYTHRGVYLASLANVIESSLNCQNSLGKNRCRYLWTLPMFHAAGWTYPYAVTCVRGTHVCLRKIEVDYVWDLLVREEITNFCAAPTVNTMLLNSKKAVVLPREVRVTVAAAPPSGKLFSDMIKHNLFPVHAYGLTETYGPFAKRYYNEEWHSLSDDHVHTLLARQGFSFVTSAKLRVTKENDITKDVAPDGKEIGEIIIRGNLVARGYHKDQEATDKSFEGGWFHSGDLAVVHPDGAIEVLDRKKDIIISGGENISSVAVESVIVKYDNVLEAAVVGIPDEHYGEVPLAVITLKDPSKPFSTQDLVKFLREHLGGYQIPRRTVVAEVLPKTSTGKVRKNVLRDQYKKAKL